MVWHKKFEPAQNILGPVKGQGMIKLFVTIPMYLGFHLFQSTLEIQKAVLNQLESYFGNQVQNAFVQFLIKDWTTEPDVGGGPVNYMAPGQMHNFHELRQEPLRYLDK